MLNLRYLWYWRYAPVTCYVKAMKIEELFVIAMKLFVHYSLLAVYNET